MRGTELMVRPGGAELRDVACGSGPMGDACGAQPMVGAYGAELVGPGWPARTVPVLAVPGTLCLSQVSAVRDAVCAAVEESPDRRVVCDVRDLHVPAMPALLGVFPAALRACGGWPRCSLALARPGPDLAALLDQLGMQRYLPVHPTVARAVADLGRDRVGTCRQVGLAPDPASPSHARRLLAQWWPHRGWGDQEEAALVVTELVTNAVEHAGTPATLGVAFSPGRTLVTVTDSSPRPVVPRPLCSETLRGRGLRIVAELSENWGVRLTHPVGKTVWAALPAASTVPAPRVA